MTQAREQIKPEKEIKDSQQKTRKKPVNTQLKKEILDNHTYVINANGNNECYVIVNNPLYIRGVWFLSDKSPVCLTDCFIDVTQVTNVYDTSTKIDHSISLTLINRYDETMLLHLTRNDIKEHKLESRLTGYADFPTSQHLQDKLMHAIYKLSAMPHVIHKKHVDTLGWITSQGEIIFMLANGYESKNGFISSEHATTIPPNNLPLSISRYTGSICDTPTDESMHMLLCELNPYIPEILVAKLGNIARVLFPIGENAGKIRYPMEVAGVTRHGKTVMDNYFLCLCGTGFNFNSATIFNTGTGGNSPVTRIEIMSLLKFLPFTDFDNKAKPDEGKKYIQQYDMRCETNAYYTDETLGSYMGKGRNTQNRPSVQGLLMRSEETYYPEYSIKHDNVSIETRTNLFIYPCGIICTNPHCQYINDEMVSMEINKKRLGLYAWGNAYRRWYMNMSQDKMQYVYEEIQSTAFKMVHSHDWLQADMLKRACIAMIEGVLLWQQFLLDCYPFSFMINWINDTIPLLINNRVRYAHELHNTIPVTIQNDMLKNILNAIRYLFKSQYWYLKDSNDKFYFANNPDLPVPIDFIGGKLNGKRDNDTTVTWGKIQVGNLVRNETHIAFSDDMFYVGIVQTLKQQSGIITNEQEIRDTLIKSDMLLPFSKRHNTTQLHIAKNKPYRLIMLLEKLYPDYFSEDSEDSEDSTDNTTSQASLVASSTVFTSEDSEYKVKTGVHRDKLAFNEDIGGMSSLSSLSSLENNHDMNDKNDKNTASISLSSQFIADLENEEIE